MNTLALFALYTSASVKCSLFQRVDVCNAVSKFSFATAFATAAPALACKTLTSSQWNKVLCHSPASHRSTKICTAAKWSAVFKLFAIGMALREKVVIKTPWNISKLVNTSAVRRILLYELKHTCQQSGVNSFKWGYRYISVYCDAGWSCSENKYEKEARRYENKIC